MTLRAVGLSRVLDMDAFSAPRVLNKRNRLKMIRVYASSIAAKMVERFGFNGADQQFVGEAISRDGSAIDTKYSVSLSLATDPQPAGLSFLYVIPKSFGCRSIIQATGMLSKFRVAITSPSLPMLTAPTTGDNDSGTIGNATLSLHEGRSFRVVQPEVISASRLRSILQ